MQAKLYSIGFPHLETDRRESQIGGTQYPTKGMQVPEKGNCVTVPGRGLVQSTDLLSGSLPLPPSVYLAVIPSSEESQFFQRNLGPRTTAFWRAQWFLCCHLVVSFCHCSHIFQRFHNLQQSFLCQILGYPETFRSSDCWDSSHSGHSREGIFPVSLRGSGGPAAMQVPAMQVPPKYFYAHIITGGQKALRSLLKAQSTQGGWQTQNECSVWQSLASQSTCCVTLSH